MITDETRTQKMTAALPFELQLPLAIATLVLLVLAAFSWMAYSEIRDSALAAAAAHLDRGARQLAAVLQASIPNKNDAIRATATNTAVVAAVTGSGNAASARVPLTRLAAADTLISSVELWSASGHRVAGVGRTLPPVDSTFIAALVSLATDTNVAPTPFRFVDGRLRLGIAARVPPRGARAGYRTALRRGGVAPQCTRPLRYAPGGGA